MLRIHVWDEISGEWSQWDLDMPPDTRDPQAISNELDRTLGEEDQDYWRVTHSQRVGPLLVAVARSGRGHCSILIVNDEEQENADPVNSEG